jgi:hypothetical protein
MVKTDDVVKRMLDSIGDRGLLKRRRFVGTSRLDQELWVNGGLSFGINGFVYGSCDFAWYTEEKWIDPFNKEECDRKPIIVIEATDCLNTKSWGSAQVQRFHHAFGPFLCGINSIYFLNRGELPIRPYLVGAAYYATVHFEKEFGNKAAYLVTDNLKDVKELVYLAADYGICSNQFRHKVSDVLIKMKKYFDKTFTDGPYYSNWIEYLESRAIIRTPTGEFVKDLGPKMASLTDSSVRYGHILVGEALTTEFLLIGSGMFNPAKENFYYFFPLISKSELIQLDDILRKDKEWALIRRAGFPWKVITLEDLEGVDNRIIREINSKFRDANLNLLKGEWEELKNTLRAELKSGNITIKKGNR